MDYGNVKTIFLNIDKGDGWSQCMSFSVHWSIQRGTISLIALNLQYIFASD